MAESWKRICLELVYEMVIRVESRSTGSHIKNMVVEMAWREVKENTVNHWLHGDKELIEFTSCLITSWQVEDK